MGWFSRWRERQTELTAGVDADLVEDNRKRWKLVYRLFACGLVLSGIQAAVKLPHLVTEIALWFAGACFVGGIFLAEWARAESRFLDSPNRPEPPSLWKFRSRR